MTSIPRAGLYAITDPDLTRGRDLNACVEQALAAGAVMVQYRDKLASSAQRRERAQSLVTLCRRFKVPLIVNDDVQLALEIGADGAHVGRDDDAVAHARVVLGPDAIVGASCYHELPLAIKACRDGADYVAFGRFFNSQTKPGQALASVALLEEARRRLEVPIVAIGGITSSNGRELIAAGANLLAVIHDLWREDDCRRRAEALVACFETDFT